MTVQVYLLEIVQHGAALAALCHEYEIIPK